MVSAIYRRALAIVIAAKNIGPSPKQEAFVVADQSVADKRDPNGPNARLPACTHTAVRVGRRVGGHCCAVCVRAPGVKRKEGGRPRRRWEEEEANEGPKLGTVAELLINGTGVFLWTVLVGFGKRIGSSFKPNSIDWMAWDALTVKIRS